jgi:hypothetical protein
MQTPKDRIALGTLRQEPLQEGISLLSGCTVGRLDSLCRSK